MKGNIKKHCIGKTPTRQETKVIKSIKKVLKKEYGSKTAKSLEFHKVTVK